MFRAGLTNSTDKRSRPFMSCLVRKSHCTSIRSWKLTTNSKAARSSKPQERAMPLPTWIDLSRPPRSGRLGLSLIVALLALAGCQTSKEEMLPHGDSTMMDVWNQGTAGSAGSASGRQLLDARAELRRPIDVRATQPLQDSAAYTRTAQNEIYSQFKRLPNPDLVMYVFPHLAGSDPAPVPGYTTVFPLYQRVQYAMPGERVEDY
ncbi:Signal recognition particle GTPase [Pseudomonas syringae pv. philadelphi]|nr:Signal recognition particle GTPase [Pseudomonas syringae pv. philadelphi]RMQ35783.1 Signal recognition particle GTPase [Pseudomonas syringae pv. berberidis]